MEVIYGNAFSLTKRNKNAAQVMEMIKLAWSKNSTSYETTKK